MENFYDMMQYDVNSAKNMIVDSSWSKKAFPYPHHRLYFIKDGEALLFLKNRKIILKKNHIYFLSAFMMVESICENFLDHQFIHFMIDSKVNTNIFEIYNPKIEVKSDNTKETQKLFNTVISNYENSAYSSKLFVNGAISTILAPFFEGVKEPSIKTNRFIPVLEYIDTNIEKDLSAKTLSRILDLEPIYFSNLFSDTFNLPLHQYILKKRLELASILLTRTNLNIKEIAYRVGFKNEIYFSKFFRKKTHMTPTQYRKIGKTEV